MFNNFFFLLSTSSTKRKYIFLVTVFVTSIITGIDWLTRDSNTTCKPLNCTCNTPDDNIPIKSDITKGLIPLHKLKHKTTIEQVAKAKGISYLDKVSLAHFYDCLPTKMAKILLEKSHEIQCHKQRRFFQRKHPVVALASFQGSGNTWVRHLLEQSTGIYTGSIYCDTTLKAAFPGEHVCSANVLVVKTHHPDSTHLPKDVKLILKRNSFDKAIVLVRNPYDALVSEANRRWNVNVKAERHLGLAKESAFIGNPKWDWYVEYKVMSWLVLLNTWLKESSIPHIVVQYEKIKANMTQELIRMLDFLDITYSDETLKCATENSNGLFKRKQHLNFDPFSKENKAAVNRIIEQSRHILSKYNINYDTR